MSYIAKENDNLQYKVVLVTDSVLVQSKSLNLLRDIMVYSLQMQMGQYILKFFSTL